MTMDSRQLRVDLGVTLTQDDYNALTMHKALRMHTRRAVDVLITMLNNDQYMVVPAS